MAGLFSAFDPVDEDNNDKDAQGNIDAQKKIQATVTPQQAAKVSELYKQNGWVSPRVLLDMAKKQGLSQQTVNAVAKIEANKLATQNDPNKTDPKGWFDRNIYSKIKAATRWGFAALQLTPDLTQNVASQLFSPNDPAGTAGVFASTQLGTMLSGEDSGEGFFFGGKAAETQAQRAKEFRGTINNHAWTIGRGAANVVFTPGTKEYSLLSGFFDAAVNIYADPTLYLGQGIKAAKTVDLAGGEKVKGLIGTRAISRKVGEVLSETGLVESQLIPKLSIAEAQAAEIVAQRGAAGLTSPNAQAFVGSKFFQWFESSDKARRLSERISGYAKTASDNLVVQAQNGTMTAESARLERGKAAAKIMADFKYKIDPEVAMQLAEADEAVKIKAVIGRASAVLDPRTEQSFFPKLIGDVRGVGATSAIRELARERVPLYRTIRNSRWWSSIPTEQAIVNGTSIDRSNAVKTYSRYLEGLRAPQKAAAKYEEFMGKAAAALSAPEGERNLLNDKLFDDFIDLVNDLGGGDKRVAAAVKELKDAEKARIATYAVDAAGQIDDGGTIQMLRQSGMIDPNQLNNFNPAEQDALQMISPTALVELVQRTYVLPDFRKLKRLTSNPIMKAAINRDGNQRHILAAAEQLQQEVWKPFVLATGGYVVRNLIDSHIRIAARGYQSFFSHPLQFIQIAMNQRFVGTLLGKDAKALTFEDIFDDAFGKNFGAAAQEVAEAINLNVYNHLKDPLNANQNLRRSLNFGLVNRATDAKAHTTGYVDNLGQIHADPILKKIAQLWSLPQNQRTNQIVAWMQTTTEGAEARKKILTYFKNGVRVSDPQGSGSTFVKLRNIDDDTLIAAWVDKLATSKISNVLKRDVATGQIDEDLRFVTSYNRVPLLEPVPFGAPGEFQVAARKTNIDSADLFVEGSVKPPKKGQTVTPGTPVSGKPLDPADIKQGTVVQLDFDKKGVITNVRTVQVPDPFNPGKLVTQTKADVQPIAKGVAFGDPQKDLSLLGSESLRELIDFKGARNELAQIVKRAERIQVDEKQDLGKIAGFMNSAVKWFFNDLVGTATQKLERSPLYRQAFYKNVADNAYLLSAAEQQKLQTNITTYVKELNTKLKKEGKRETMSVEKYVGNKEIYNRIFGKVATGDGTIEQLEQFSSIVALQELREVLYNAVEKSNIEDALRVIVPFATAFRETLGKYTSYLVEDPSRIRKTQLAFDAADYDSDNSDNALSGWFAEDPINGTNVFNFPVGGWAGAMLQFPLKGAFQVLNLPGGGPIIQIAASNMLPDTPKLEFVRKMILPYGEKGVSSLAPQWAVRGFEAIKGDTGKLGTIYANTYMEVVRHKIQTGSYNTKDPNDMAKLYADARRKAQVLAGLRALFQFTGPTSPQIDFRLETDGGDIIASALSQEFYKLKTKNPDTVVSDFINKFGEDAFIYMGHKTEPTTSGIEPTKVFSDWAKENNDLMQQYKGVAGFFAPGGDSFSFEAFNRQIQKGERKRLTAEEMVAAAQYRIASSIYREKRNQLGASLNQEQRDWLSQWRVLLNEEYPGFPIKADFNPGEFPNFINELRTAVTDNRLADNDVANATKQYLDARDQALAKAAEAGYKGFQSPKTQPLKDWLASIAATLVQQTPEFARIFEDKLAAEVD
jgi:hypothetical protein